MLREFSRNGPAVEVLCDRMVGPMHARLCRIWAAATGQDTDSDAVVEHRSYNPEGITQDNIVPRPLEVIVCYGISTVARRQVQAMQLEVFYFLPSLLLSGFMFAYRSMPNWARRCLTHILLLIRAMMLKGADYAAVAQPMAALTLFVAPFAALA